MNKINLEYQWINLIKNSIQKYLLSPEIFIFGSRVKNRNRKYSDVDIAIKNGNNIIDSYILSAILFELEESDIPYKIDLVDYNLIQKDILNIAIQI